MEVTLLEAISRMLRIAGENPEGTLYIQAGKRTKVLLREGSTGKQIMQGPQAVFTRLRARLLEMASLPAEEDVITREGRIIHLVDGEMRAFLLRETRSLLDPSAYLLTLCCQREE